MSEKLQRVIINRDGGDMFVGTKNIFKPIINLRKKTLNSIKSSIKNIKSQIKKESP